MYPVRQVHRIMFTLAQRARIVPRCAEGLSNKAVGAVERVTGQTVGKWRARFVKQRLTGLDGCGPQWRTAHAHRIAQSLLSYPHFSLAALNTVAALRTCGRAGLHPLRAIPVAALYSGIGTCGS